MVLKCLAALKVSEEGLDKRHKHRRLLIKQKKRKRKNHLQHHFLFLSFGCSLEIADDAELVRSIGASSEVKYFCKIIKVCL